MFETFWIYAGFILLIICSCAGSILITQHYNKKTLNKMVKDVEDTIKLNFKEFEDNIKALPQIQKMTEMNIKGMEAKQTKALERKIANDLLNVNAPEIKAVLQYFSPDTLKYIESNPEVAMAVIQRFKPLLDKFMGAGQKKDDTEGGLIF